jgi:hypothetical protein
MAARILALLMIAQVGALLLLLTLSTGATFTAPSTNPSNQIGTSTLVAPTALSWSLLSNGASVHLAWIPTTSSWASGHRVYRASSVAGPYSQIAQLAGLATTSYDDAPGSGTFFYVVRGYYGLNGANWESSDSNKATSKNLDHFTFATIASQHSGSAFSATITAQASDNTTVPWSGTVALTVNGGAISPTTSGAFAGGTLVQSVTITGAYKPNEAITATAGTPSRTGTSNAFALDHFRATVVALTNKAGGVAGQPENGDRIVLTFNEAANTASVGTCTGATTSGTDLGFVSGQNNASDSVAANGTRLRIGTIVLGTQGYLQNDEVADNSTCAWSAGNTVLTITLQGLAAANSGTVPGSSTATWTPSATLTSAAAEAIDAVQKPSVTAVLF